MRVAASGLHLRLGPGTTFRSVAVLPHGAELRGVGGDVDIGGWFQVMAGDGRTGWVAGWHTEPIRPRPESYPLSVAGLDRYLRDSGIRWFRGVELNRAGRLPAGGGDPLRMAPYALWPRAVQLAEVLDWIRDTARAPVIVTSGYRDPAYNRAVGGAALSQHMRFAAADIRIPGLTPAEVRAIVTRHPRAGLLWTALYESFVHVDIRGMPEP
jgi:hypothetical protein